MAFWTGVIQFATGFTKALLFVSQYSTRSLFVCKLSLTRGCNRKCCLQLVVGGLADIGNERRHGKSRGSR